MHDYVLNLFSPCCAGIGGDAFCLYFDAKTRKVSALLGNGGAPAALTLQVLTALPSLNHQLLSPCLLGLRRSPHGRPDQSWLVDSAFMLFERGLLLKCPSD